jgi:hypothetical protein
MDGDIMAIRTKTSSRENDPYVLPSDNGSLKEFIFKYKIDMTQRVVATIEYAIKHRLPIIEVFQFKGSKFVATISPDEFDINLESIYNYYIQTERYELCEKIVKLRHKLKTTINEKKKNQPTGDQ